MERLLVDFSLSRSVEEFAEAMSVPLERVRLALESPTRVEFYKQVVLKKSRGQTRDVYIAQNWLLRCQDTLMRRLRDYATFRLLSYPGPYSHGYAPRRSNRTNALQHLQAQSLLTVDVRDFFESIKSEPLAKCLTEAFAVSAETARWISTLVTINDRLAQGLVTSPFLSDIYCLGLDKKMSELAENSGCIYTRYADDLAFSSRAGGLPNLADIEAILAAFNLTLASEKTRYRRRGQAQFVTGLDIQSAMGPRVPKKLKARLRQEIYYASKFGVEAHAERTTGDASNAQFLVNRITGRLNYVRGIEGAESLLSLRERWMSSIAQQGLGFEPKARARRWWSDSHGTVEIQPAKGLDLATPQEVLVCIDETFYQHRTMLGIVVVTEPAFATQAVDSLMDALKRDTFLPGKREHWDSKGFHYAEDHPAVRLRLVQLMAQLSLSTFLGVGARKSAVLDGEDYLELFKTLIRTILMKLTRARGTIVIEQQSIVPMSEIQSAYDDVRSSVYTALAKSQWPKFEIRSSANKSESCIALADYSLGIFRDWIKAPTNHAPCAMFWQIRHQLEAVYCRSLSTVRGRNDSLDDIARLIEGKGEG